MGACNCCSVLHTALRTAVLAINTSKINLWVWIPGRRDSRGCPIQLHPLPHGFPFTQVSLLPLSHRGAGVCVWGPPDRAGRGRAALPVRAEHVPGGMGLGSGAPGAAGRQERLCRPEPVPPARRVLPTPSQAWGDAGAATQQRRVKPNLCGRARSRVTRAPRRGVQCTGEKLPYCSSQCDTNGY